MRLQEEEIGRAGEIPDTSATNTALAAAVETTTTTTRSPTNVGFEKALVF